jgi:hypothetical protein
MFTSFSIHITPSITSKLSPDIFQIATNHSLLCTELNPERIQ